jgi:hypothetical protein
MPFRVISHLKAYVDNPWKLNPVFVSYINIGFHSSSVFFWAVKHIRRLPQNDPKLSDIIMNPVIFIASFWMMGLSLKKFQFPWDVHTCPICIKNNPIVCCRCHVVSQSQSMLGKFVESLVYSARLWYEIVLKLLYLG